MFVEQLLSQHICLYWRQPSSRANFRTHPSFSYIQSKYQKGIPFIYYLSLFEKQFPHHLIFFFILQEMQLKNFFGEVKFFFYKKEFGFLKKRK